MALVLSQSFADVLLSLACPFKISRAKFLVVSTLGENFRSFIQLFQTVRLQQTQFFFCAKATPTPTGYNYRRTLQNRPLDVVFHPTEILA